MMEGQQRIGVLVELPAVLREMGVDPATVIAGVGINPDLLRNPENSLSFVELGRLIEASVVATRCEHFGLLVGQRSGTASLGLVGRLMQNAPTLKDAILDLCTNQRRYVRGAVTYLVIQNDIAFWGYAVHHPGMPAIEHLSDGAIAVGFNMMRELVGSVPDEVLTSRRVPGDTNPYRRFFGVTPRFDAEQHAMAFPAPSAQPPCSRRGPRAAPNTGRKSGRVLGRRTTNHDAHGDAHAPCARDFSRRLPGSGRERAIHATPDVEPPIAGGGQELP
jgi:hypothetical protein